MQLLAFLVFLHVCFPTKAAEGFEDCDVKDLPFIPLEISPKESSWSQSLDLYSFSGYKKRPSRLFMDAHLQINLTEKDVKIYQGDNCSAVLQQFDDDRRLFGLLRQFSVMRSKQLAPFDLTIVGIATNEPYTVRVRVWEINYLRAGAFFGAIFLYLLSYSLVRNAIFFYSSGCAVGVIASLLIVGFAVYRFAPKKWVVGVPLLFGGWSFSLYSVYFLWRNFTAIILGYQKFVAAYFATVILISFGVCYRYGPPTDVRSHNLAQWALQLIALIIIYLSSQIDEISLAVIALLIGWSCMKNWICTLGSKFLSLMGSIWRVFFPKTRRLLTIEEYDKQGAEETKKAMEQLRSFCRSPKADAWKITSAIKDPKRFASFIEGSSEHVTDEEIRLYEVESMNADQLSDDSGEDELLLEDRQRRLNVSENNLLRRRMYMRDEFVFPQYDRRRNFANTSGDENVDEEEADGNIQQHLEMSARSLPLRKTRSSPLKRLRPTDSEYNGLLMPALGRLPRSDIEQLSSFYNLTAQQTAIYKLLRERGMHPEPEYIGDTRLYIKHCIPDECFDEEAVEEDLTRLAEVGLIQEGYGVGRWRIA